MNASIHNCMDDREIAQCEYGWGGGGGQAIECECTQQWAFSMQGECTGKVA